MTKETNGGDPQLMQNASKKLTIALIGQTGRRMLGNTWSMCLKIVEKVNIRIEKNKTTSIYLVKRNKYDSPNSVLKQI